MRIISKSKSVFVSTLLAGALTASGAASTPASAQDVVKIGVPLALTGALAESGKEQEIAYDLWREKVNAAGGINVGGKKMKVEYVKYDYQSDGKRVGQLVEKMIIDDKANFLVGPFGSGHTKIAAGVAERYGVPLVAPASSSIAVYDQGFKNLFGTLAPDGGLADAMVKFFNERVPNMKTVAVLGRDDIFPRSMAKLMVTAAPKHGIKVVYDELYPIGTLDHSAALTRIRSLDPDWIYFTGYTPDLILLRKQMVDLGVKAPIVTMVTGPAYKEFIDALGPLANGVTSVTWWHQTQQYKSNDVFGSTKVFYDAIYAKQGHDPDYVQASSAAVMVVLKAAIEKAGTLDRDKVREALRNLDIVTFYGPVKFSENGQNQVRDVPIIQVQNQVVELLAPQKIKTSTLQLMKN